MFGYNLFLNLFTIYLPFFFFGLFIPSYIRKTLLFGVNIPEEVLQYERVKELKREYARNFIASYLLAVTLIVTIAIRNQNLNLLNNGILICILLFTLNYIYIHLKTKRLKAAEGWLINKKQVVVVSTSRSTKRIASMKWFIIPLSVMIFTWLFTMIMYPHLPEDIPMNMDMEGNVLRYATKSFTSAFGLPLTQMGMLAMFYYLARAIGKSKLAINPSKPKTSEAQSIIFNRRWVGFTIFTSVVLNLYFAYLQLTILNVIKPSPRASLITGILALAAPILYLIVVAITTGQSGSKIIVNTDEEGNEKLVYRDDDKYWKLGTLYYNPQDPSLWVEKRFGIGWTINIGNPIGQLIGAGTIILLVVTLIITII